jgi:signal transduction histidine kinase/ActR/RegA family two-component response regulator
VGARSISTSGPGATSDAERPIVALSLEAERRLIWMRLFVSAVGTLILPFVAEAHGAARGVAYALLAAGWLQSIACLVHEPALRFFTRHSTTLFTSAVDISLTLVWVYATGGVDSPWFVAIHASILWVSLNRRPSDTIVAAVFAGLGYLLIAVVRGQLVGHVADVAVRVEYMGVVAVGSAIIARERLGRLTSRLALLDLTQQVGQIGTWEWSLQDQTLTWSGELYRIFGVPRGFKPTFEHYLSAVHPDDRAVAQELIERARVEREGFRFDHRIVLPDGEIRSLHCRGRVVLGGDGEVREMVGSAQDITERKKMEAQLLLAGKLASLGTLASGVAHEINNPLAYVASNLELIERQLDELGPGPSAAQLERLRAAVSAARHGSTRVRDIVRGLRTFSRAPQEGRQLVDLAHVADLAIEIVAHQLAGRARLVRDYAPMPRVPANESRLSQVVMNLLVNAAQAIEPGKEDDNEIRVRIYGAPDGAARIDVSDTGSGIATEHQGRIFDPFFTTKATGEGTGLGLSICHGIVHDLGGDIRVATTGEKGTTFRVSFPVGDGASVERVPSEPALLASASRKSVFIIDDEARYAESLRLLLGCDHDVTLAASADRALEVLGSGASFDVVFCDLMMPGKTGMDLYDALAMRRSPVRERIVFITGGATNERAREFLARPEIRHVEKPVEVADLRALIDEVSSLPRAPAPAARSTHP